MYWFSKKKNFIIMLAPTLLIYLAYIIIPLFVAVYYSFTNFRGVSAPDFIGFKNYLTLFKDKFFLVSVKNTVVVLGMSLVLRSFSCEGSPAASGLSGAGPGPEQSHKGD